MEITIKFQAVTDGFPPAEENIYYGGTYSIECMAIVKGKVFDRSVRYCFPDTAKWGIGGWVWGDWALGDQPDEYADELGGDEPTLTHWAPWPKLESSP